MTPRGYLDFLRDILDMMAKVEQFTQGMTYDRFVSDDRTVLAVQKALENIGEAAKQVPYPVRRQFPAIPWANMAGMRDRLIHGYFGADLDVVWKTAIESLPALRPSILQAIETLSESDLPSSP